MGEYACEVDMISLEHNEKLYKDPFAALEFAKTLPSEEIMEYHFFWGPQRPFGRKPALALKSCIVTQKMLAKRVNLWVTDIDATKQSEEYKQIQSFVHLRYFHSSDLAVGTALEGKKEWLEATDDHCWLDGDLARLLILYRYGGIWVDCDTVLLRDLYPLVGQEFIYQWGTELDKLAGGVIRAFKGSKWVEEMLDELATHKPDPVTTTWGSDVWSPCWKPGCEMVVYPCAFFNTEWMIKGIDIGGGHHAMRVNKHSQDMWDGAFGWHWHNKWDYEPIEKGSKWELLETLMNKRLADVG